MCRKSEINIRKETEIWKHENMKHMQHENTETARNKGSQWRKLENSGIVSPFLKKTFVKKTPSVGK